MEERRRISIEYPGGVTDDAALVTPLGDGRYRLDMDPVSWLIANHPQDLEGLPNYGDVIEAVETAPNTLRFVRVLERAPLRKFEFLVSRDIAGSPELQTILSKVAALEGHWERVAGGALTIYLPKDGDYDPSEDIRQLRAGQSDHD